MTLRHKNCATTQWMAVPTGGSCSSSTPEQGEPAFEQAGLDAISFTLTTKKSRKSIGVLVPMSLSQFFESG